MLCVCSQCSVFLLIRFLLDKFHISRPYFEACLWISDCAERSDFAAELVKPTKVLNGKKSVTLALYLIMW